MNAGRCDAWLRQAAADLDAGRSTQGEECHRRYWLQQACEKGIKALGLILWRGGPANERLFTRHFLHDHSPLQKVSKAPADKHLALLRRQLDAELGRIDGASLIRKVDATTPSLAPDAPSYRYPFRDFAGGDTAPVDWGAAEWNEYQGDFMGVVAAVERLLRSVRNTAKRNRPPG